MCTWWAITRDFGTAQMSLLNAKADESSKARGLNSDPSLHLHPFFVCGGSEGSGESMHMRRLACVFAARRCDKYRNLVRWPI